MEGWRGVGRDPRGAKAVTFQWQWSHLFCLYCVREDLFYHFGAFLGHILTFSGPAASSVEFLWFKMAGTGVPHIVLHVLGSTLTSGGILGPKRQFCQK